MSRIKFSNVTKSFPLKPGQKWLRTHLGDIARGDARRFVAIRDVSFSLEDGESVAIVGRNGAGKSTLLNLTAGMLSPNAGSIEVEGRVAPLLDLGAGFHGDLTGRENLRITTALMGLSRSEVDRKADAIIDFSGLGDFIDQPLRTYSSGMAMRLAFSITASVEADIVLIDEVLAVGDAAFQAKCFERILELKARGKIFLCVSHSMAIDQLCETAIWLEQGVVRATGPIMDVMEAYTASLAGSMDIRREETPPKLEYLTPRRTDQPRRRSAAG
jgi:ABC-type polysaccharide/polyol phosphate transport system ATPase subunit